MPVLAAWSTCTPLAMPSSRLLMSLARLSSDWAVKKLVGLSRAELTLLPVDRRFCVVARRSAVDWRERRFWRTEEERTIPDIGCYLSGKRRLLVRVCMDRVTQRPADRGAESSNET